MVIERYGQVAARVLMSVVFLVNGLNIVSQSLALHEMVVHGIPVSLAHGMLLGGQVLQVIASIGLIFGIYPRLAALALILFLIPATLMAHAFWQVAGTQLYAVQVINFCKNVGMAGGLAFVAATTVQPVRVPPSTR